MLLFTTSERTYNLELLVSYQENDPEGNALDEFLSRGGKKHDSVYHIHASFVGMEESVIFKGEEAEAFLRLVGRTRAKKA